MRATPAASRTALLLVFLLAGIAGASAQTIQGLGAWGPTAISSDGTAVVGEAVISASPSDYWYEAYLWKDDSLKVLLESDSSPEASVSADGSFVVGQYSARGSCCADWAFRWHADSLELLPFDGALGVSADGVVVGHDENREDGHPYPWHAVVYDRGVTTLGRGTALGISDDGSVVIWFNYEAGAFRLWPSSLEVGRNMYARRLSADGSTVVGWTNEGLAVRWRDEVPDWLGPGWAVGVSEDGSVVVGQGVVGPFIWTEAEGMRDLVGVLVEDYGLDLGGWMIESVADISADGTVLVGSGINPEGTREAWRVELPQAGPVPNEPDPDEPLTSLALYSPFPNPSHVGATLRYDVPQPARVRVTVFDMLGREVVRLVDGYQLAGRYEAVLDAAVVAQGVYLVRLEAEAGGSPVTLSRRVTLLR